MGTRNIVSSLFADKSRVKTLFFMARSRVDFD